MRIAVCHPVFWPEVRRGAERMTHELARGLRARGHDAWIATTHERPPRRDEAEGVPVRRAWRPPGSARLQRRGFEPFLLAAPGTALGVRGADVAIALQPAAAVAAARTGVPTVFAYMGIPHRRAVVGRRLGAETLVAATRAARTTTALSRHAADAFETWFGVEAAVIPPPVDLTTFSPGGPRTPEPTAVFAGDPAEPRKRFDLLERAWPLVREHHPDARLVVNGRDGVVLDDRTRLARTYASAWASVLPSWGEAFGLVLAEALACGTPAVGARAGGIPEVLGDAPVGALFDGEDPAALAQAILAAFALAPHAAQACRERAESFSAERCAAAYEALCFDAAS